MPLLRLLASSSHADGWAIPVDRLRTTRRGDHTLVSATVDGRCVWFDSSDAALATAPEAFGSALLVAAMHAGRPLCLSDTVCETWAANLRPLVAAFRDLWYPDAPMAHVVPEAPLSIPPQAQTQAQTTALCFSGGVDAFHTYFESGQRIDLLAYVVGYDVKLRQRRQAGEVVRSLRAIATETGTRSVVIRTNLRRHPLLRAARWERTCGGPLAAIGHLLRAEAGRLLISGVGLGFEHPEAGTRVGTDHLFGSRATVIEHVAATVTRLEKIRRIAAEPLVQRHLRVCWQNLPGRPNCGRCEKCVRTMLSLEACGMLGRFPGFDHGRGLGDAVDALPEVDGIAGPFYRDLLSQGLGSQLAAGVRRLLGRSRAEQACAAQAACTKGGGSGRPVRSRGHRLFGPEMFGHVCEPLVGRRVGYVRPLGNVGDELIELAMVQLFALHGIRWSLADLDAGPRALAGFDLLVFGGGGNMGTRYAANHDLRSRALATGLPVTILPQSFTNAEGRPFHRVYVRERGSLLLRPDGILAPDLALGLEWREPPRATHELGVYLRRDQERRGRKPLFVRDPIRLARTPAEYLAFAARHRRIITDRLHFAVAGLHAGREVTLVANDYHKNRSMHETWLADLGCRFAESPAEALGHARRAA